MQEGFKEPTQKELEVVRDPEAKLTITTEYSFTWSVYGSKMEGKIMTSLL